MGACRRADRYAMILSHEGRAKLLQLQTGFFLDRALVGPNTYEVQFIVKAPFEIIAAARHVENVSVDWLRWP
jgi:hypothetical protein